MRSIVWFRDEDLRLSDHAPLADAEAKGDVIPLFVLEPRLLRCATEAPNRLQFVLDSLLALEAGLADRGTKLVVVPGESEAVIPRLAGQWSADRVLAHRSVDPEARQRDRLVAEALGHRFELHDGATLARPGALRTGSGTPYSVFTPFARAFGRDVTIARPLPPPRALPPLPAVVRTRSRPIPRIEDLGLTRNHAVLPGGESAALARLQRFLRAAAPHYALQRDRMDLEGTSRLSADLRSGTLSIRQVWTAVDRALDGSASAQVFQNELVWREFTHATLWDRPDLLERPFRPRFAGFPWHDDEQLWQAWVLGKTGYPVVDASARQLLAEGFVHNRARMISASFLTKDLLVDYRLGEAHYMKHLTDGNAAQNNSGWQWSAGCGCDAQPYFRVFNPTSQGARFDPEGDYVRRHLPELARLPARFIHRPSEAPPSVLQSAGVRLGETYPFPVVDHRYARERFLALAREHVGAASPPPD